MALTIITNNVPRLLMDGYELTDAERMQFDYIDWSALDDGRASATFFRYRGELYDLAEFMASTSGPLTVWDGHKSDTFFSGIVVRYDPNDSDRVIVGRFYS